jgi:hypothetical protein
VGKILFRFLKNEEPSEVGIHSQEKRAPEGRHIIALGTAREFINRIAKEPRRGTIS